MDISIYTIMKELNNGIELIQSDNLSFDIREVCICAESLISNEPGKNTLYILGRKQKGLLAKYNFTHILSMESLAELPESVHTYAFLPKPMSAMLLAQQIQKIINKYNDWYHNIISEMHLYQSPQDIIERCESLFPYPFAYFDTTRAMLYKTSSLKGVTQNHLWDYALSTGFAPDESYDEQLFRLIYENEKPFLYTSRNQYKGYLRLIAPIKMNQHELGCLVTNLQNMTFQMDEISSFYYIQQVFSLGLKYFGRLQSNEDNLPWYYEKILSGEHLENNVLENCVHMTGHEADERFLVWLLRKEEALPLKKAIRYLHSLFKRSNIKIYRNFIIIIDYKIAEHKEPAFLDSLQNMLQDIRYSCGVSQEFDDISFLYQAYSQALTALEYAKNNLIQAADIISKHTIRLLSEAQNISVFLHPDIVKLSKNKKNADNHLLLTLQTYLLTGLNLTTTAKKLYIHRHTANYRLETIHEITGLDFSACTTEMLMQILFSCEYFLKYD